MTMIPEADQLIEDVYDLIFRECPLENRVSVARIVKLAAQYRVNQLRQQRMQRAIELRRADRRALIRDGGGHSDPGGVASPSAAGQEGETQ